ncbi:PREDICTED: protein Dok-7 [Chrysochloris asiatica]|uniref:Protein Dok-7 n=1 Tax=Chrysochloris asiatica TaxID=185453 RepID=A0A9B0X0G9_CHRAS|nr:PREDICTED: protein Dok-7 [Chrysochloris asiatica]
MLIYKDQAERIKGLRERSSLTLEDICGLEPGLPYEGLVHTLAIICRSQAIMLGFEGREAMCAWDARIRYELGEVHRFHVTVAPGTKLQSGPATLHLCNDILVVTRDVPPAITGQWKLSDLRRYGAVPNGFIFEGGTRCGYWAGVFFLSSTEGEQISFLFDCIVRGISPTKGPFSLRPVLPDPSPGGASTMEERAAQEALQLEKRLSLLSHSGHGHPGSRGDDRSLSSSSSEASHSDVSAGSRLTAWPEPSLSSASTSQEGPGPPSTRALHLGEAAAPGEEAPGPSQQPPKPLRPRQLQEVGRQGSSDSGIATGSHSSCSGSFSSYAGSSLDVWPAADDFGSLLSLPPVAGGPEPGLCACPPGVSPRVAEYQVPGAPRPHYDTPRSLRQAPRDQDPASQGGPDKGAAATTTAAGDSGSQTSTECPSGWLGTEVRGPVTEAPGEPWEVAVPHTGTSPAWFSTCPVCGGLKATLALLMLVPAFMEYSRFAPSVLRCAILDALRQVWLVSIACSRALGLSEDRFAEGARGTVTMPWTLPLPLSVHRPCPGLRGHSAVACLGALGEASSLTQTFSLVQAAAATPTGLPRAGALGPGDSEAPVYLNLPVSPSAGKQPHYLGLQLQGAGPAVRGASASRYAHIDVTATETAHRVGTQHAQTREERLPELEQRRRAQP